MMGVHNIREPIFTFITIYPCFLLIYYTNGYTVQLFLRPQRISLPHRERSSDGSNGNWHVTQDTNANQTLQFMSVG